MLQYTTAIVTRMCVTAAVLGLEQLNCHETALFLISLVSVATWGKRAKRQGPLGHACASLNVSHTFS